MSSSDVEILGTSEEKKVFECWNGMKELIEEYDAFILDQFGVMHNGSYALPGAVECVEYMANQGKSCIILSNTSSSSQQALEKLPRLGFDSRLFQTAVTSGEEASHFLRSTYATRTEKLKVLWLTWKNSIAMEFLQYCFPDNMDSLELTTNVLEADLILAHGADCIGTFDQTIELTDFHSTGDLSTFQQYVLDPLLSSSQSTDSNAVMPIMICANPDLIMKKPNGRIAYMPGTLAKEYQAKGGDVKYFGKPHVEHFQACLDALRKNHNDNTKIKVAHIGDSLHHDVAGANATHGQIDAVFVTGGIHLDELDCSSAKNLPSQSSLNQLFTKYQQTPKHVIPMLKL